MGQPAGKTKLLQKNKNKKFIALSIITIALKKNHIHSFAMHLSQKMSHSRVSQLRELQGIIEEISRAIMWVNEKEEEELVFDWGDKNIDNYIPKKQESYSVSISD